MNKAAKFMIAIFAVIAVIVSVGLLYTFIVGSEADVDSEQSASAEENTAAFDLQEAAENAEDGEVIWSADIGELQLNDFSLSENGAGLTVALSDRSSEEVAEWNQALDGLPINFEVEDE
ncbi:hypothetical protein HUG15_04535 [Salicibibacter cibarius]|uniref:Uncharacterized protein n=1 Tax=Salicibibacter cibarius TaxID=2743000 RepID=A0A7T6Z0W0_9BACI|nr:hypothetical protein [Salicibibacter cibarius]QQK74940.1 hypothetical protein HUG15_04535 [Salicibibacter cibarius]